MRKLLLMIGLVFSLLANAQLTEVNPNIKWEFVRSQEIPLQSGRTYQFEFPAEKAYDYIFNLDHENRMAYASISVQDVQQQPLTAKSDSANTESMDLAFRVKDNGTYFVTLVLSNGQTDTDLPCTLTLIRRPIVAY